MEFSAPLQMRPDILFPCPFLLLCVNYAIAFLSRRCKTATILNDSIFTP